MLLSVGEWSAQSESIRTAFEIPFEVDLFDEKDVALYVKISEKVAHLQRLGMTYRQIGERLGMSRWLCRKAGQYAKSHENESIDP